MRRSAPRRNPRTLGDYPQLGKDAARDIPGSKLVELRRVGHISHLEVPEPFHQALMEFLKSPRVSSEK
jgi:pimeloyl-ACP methyl ester carboxylesterase